MRKVATILAAAVLAVMTTSVPAAAAPQPLPQQWWFEMWGVHDKLWAHSKGQGVIVAVLDTGVQADLPELHGAVLPGADFESGEGDGRTDLDVHTTDGHGTAMAMLIASRGGDTGYLGIAPRAQILPVVTQSTSAYAKGIRFAADHGAKVINLSQGVPGACPLELQNAIRYAIDRDAVIVAAAGNNGLEGNPSMHPANCKGVVAVGAVDMQASPWEKGERHSYVDLAGPGVSITTVLRDGALQEGINGTSVSAALVSGVVALVRAKYPQMTNREVVQKLLASAKDVGPPGKDDASGHGVPRPYRILTGPLPPGTGNPVFEEYDAWARVVPTVSAPEATHRPQMEPSYSSQSFSWDDFVVLAGVAVILGVGIPVARNRQRRQAQRLYGGRSPQFPSSGPPPPPGYGPPPGPPPQQR